jgi:hypothetical protein
MAECCFGAWAKPQRQRDRYFPFEAIPFYAGRFPGTIAFMYVWQRASWREGITRVVPRDSHSSLNPLGAFFVLTDTKRLWINRTEAAER